MALVDPAGLATPNRIPPDGLSRRAPAAGVLLLRSFLGRGYKGPEPIKGHGPHRYAFELFALGAELPPTVMTRALDRAKPRTVLEGIEVPVLARGRLTGLYER